MNANSLQVHMSKTYFSLRLGLVVGALIAVLMPLWGALLGVSLQGSLSAYYHAVGTGGVGVREVFVGVLCGVGGLLIAYKGFGDREDWLLNAAGTFAFGVALFPMDWPPEEAAATGVLAVEAAHAFSWHGLFAVLFFLCIAGVCLFCASKTLVLFKDKAKSMMYRRVYWGLGALMVALPLGAFGLLTLVARDYVVLVVEILGVVVFGVFWGVKTRELWETHAELLIMRGETSLTSEVSIEPSANAGEVPLGLTP